MNTLQQLVDRGFERGGNRQSLFQNQQGLTGVLPPVIVQACAKGIGAANVVW